MTNSQENKDQNTPRTRNRVFDSTTSMASPEGYTKGDWTFRKQLEADFRALGFRSHKFSHKKEPLTRRADSLWLSWTSDGKNLAENTAVSNVVVRATFSEYKTTITVTHYENVKGKGGCLPWNRRVGKATFVGMDVSSDVLAYVEHLLPSTK
jgi:hypothetical protein